MNPMHFRINSIILSLLVGSGFLINPLFAESVRSYESRQKIEPTKKKLSDFLKGLDGSIYPDSETEGMQWHYSTGVLSAFNYDIYAGTISASNPTTVVRLEGDTGDILTMARILELEGILVEGASAPPYDTSNTSATKLEEKNHIYSQGLNLAAPWLAVIHASWNSPRLTTGQTVFRFISYFFFDGLMVWAGGTGLWQESFNIKKYGGSIAAALAIPRLIGSVQHANLIRGHNRIARMGYTFYID